MAQIERTIFEAIIMSGMRYAKDLPTDDNPDEADRILNDRLTFYWQGLRDRCTSESLQKALNAHFQQSRFMPQVSEILDQIYSRRTESPAVTEERLRISDGEPIERWQPPTRQPYMNPTLPDDERLLDADALLAKSDLELQALGLKRSGIEFIRSMLSAAQGEDAVRLRVRERLAQTSEAYEMRPAFEGLMPHGVAQEISQQYAREEKPKQKRRKRQGVG